LIVKRVSDLLSKWVGETEQQIAEAFDEAINRNGVLLFDEVDSLLYDRSSAKQSWEVTQVNELLTWFDSHPLPFIAATNHGHKLDPAAARRFVFKLDLKPLPADKVAIAYRRFFKADAPADLSQLHGLTPGDLAVVARQLRYRDAGTDVVALLAAELAAKPEGGGRIGF
jgi:SpoVK/Ycf46/Vps4 family AAA+-type ATPase